MMPVRPIERVLLETLEELRHEIPAKYLGNYYRTRAEYQHDYTPPTAEIYCPSCGMAVSQKLKYCKRCGGLIKMVKKVHKKRYGTSMLIRLLVAPVLAIVLILVGVYASIEQHIPGNALVVFLLIITSIIFLIISMVLVVELQGVRRLWYTVLFGGKMTTAANIFESVPNLDDSPPVVRTIPTPMAVTEHQIHGKNDKS